MWREVEEDRERSEEMNEEKERCGEGQRKK